jgi:hypothetical protein
MLSTNRKGKRKRRTTSVIPFTFITTVMDMLPKVARS